MSRFIFSIIALCACMSIQAMDTRSTDTPSPYSTDTSFSQSDSSQETAAPMDTSNIPLRDLVFYNKYVKGSATRNGVPEHQVWQNLMDMYGEQKAPTQPNPTVKAKPQPFSEEELAFYIEHVPSIAQSMGVSQSIVWANLANQEYAGAF